MAKRPLFHGLFICLTRSGETRRCDNRRFGRRYSRRSILQTGWAMPLRIVLPKSTNCCRIEEQLCGKAPYKVFWESKVRRNHALIKRGETWLLPFFYYFFGSIPLLFNFMVRVMVFLGSIEDVYGRVCYLFFCCCHRLSILTLYFWWARALSAEELASKLPIKSALNLTPESIGN